MTNKLIRPIAIGIIINDDCIFVFEGHDPKKGETFYRPLGGAIKFGERGEAALIREFKEEINADLTDIHYLAAMENIFTYNGVRHHEIALIYKCRFVDDSLYAKDELIGHEDDGSQFKCYWQPLSNFYNNKKLLYPDGIVDFLKHIYHKTTDLD